MAAIISAVLAAASLATGIATAVTAGGGEAPPPVTPPAQPAKGPRTGTGAIVSIGNDGIANQRVSGSRAGGNTSSSTDVLGGLGSAGGIRI